MDFDKLQKDVERLEKTAQEIESKGEPAKLREFATVLKSILQDFLKDRKEQIRPGQLCRDAAAKNIIPGDVAPRADALLVRWGGNVTPQEAQTVKDDGAKFLSVAAKLIPVLKAYRKEERP